MKRTFRALPVAAAGLVALLGNQAPLVAQHPNVARGFTPSGMFDVGGIDSVNGFNGNMTIHIPIGGSYPVGGMMGSYAFSLNYNSNVWDHVTRHGVCNEGFGSGHPVTDVLAVPDPYGNAGLGWSFSLGNIGTLTSIGGFDTTPRPGRTTYRGMDGSEHALHASYPTPGGGYATDPGYWFSNDGSYLRFHEASQTLEMPDGMRHTFANGRPMSIRDRFDNGLTITYPEYFPAPNADLPRIWEIQDGHRTHRVFFQLTGYAAPEQRVVVERIELAAFGGDTATYRFLYNDADENGNGFQEVRMRGFGTQLRTCNPYVDWWPRVVLLTKLLLPDGTSYSMPVLAYRTEGVGYPGPISRLRLPTTGTIGWDYTLNAMPAPRPDDEHPWVVPTWSFALGVSKRSLYGASNQLIGDWLYSSAYNVTARPNEIVREITYPPAEAGQPVGHRARTYYSGCVYASCVNEPGAPDGPSSTYADDFGLPFSRRQPGDGQGRFLSQEIFAPGASTPLRRIYVAYENDGDPSHPNLPFDSASHLNQRPRSERVVYLDDPLPSSVGGGYASSTSDSEDFDGLGHYRRVTKSDNFGFGASRTETTGWNPNGRPTGPDPWILTAYDFTEQQEGSAVAHQELLFEPATGFLRCRRAFKGGRNRGAFDVVAQFDHTNPSQPGQLTQERWLGGDTQRISTSVDCDSLPEPAAYTYTHEYSHGVRSKSTIPVATAAGGVLSLLDLTIDPNTGLVLASRDAAGRPTDFSYDRMGRLKTSSPRGDATTTIDYQLSSSAPPIVQMTVGAGSPLESQAWRLDGLGRVVESTQAMPAGQVGGKRTAYNAMGWTTFVSERSFSPGSGGGTAFSGFDLFGRPKTVQAADGKVTTIEYRGVRIVKRISRVWNGTKEAVATRREDYDCLGRLRLIREPNGIWTRYTYDVGGRLTIVVNNAGTGNSVNSQTRSFRYDGRGFLVRQSEPESGASTYSYDAMGNVTRRSTPTGTVLSDYDEAGRLLAFRSAQNVLNQLVYRADGKVATAVAFNDRPVDSTCKRFEVRQDFEYDSVHGRISSEETTLRRSDSSQPIQKWSQSYLYNGEGAVTQVTYPFCLLNCGAQPRAVTTTFDKGRPVSVSGFASSITYSANGRAHTVQHANGVVFKETPDPSGVTRPGALQADLGTTKLWPREEYLYDGEGNITKIGTKTFVYDLASRLTSAFVPSAGASPYQGYSYDAFNNLASISGGASAAAATTVRYDASPATNRLTGATYDAAGNLLAYQGNTYSWDRLQHLASVSTGSESWVHTYNASGERVWSWRTAPSRLDTYALRARDGRLLTDFTQEGPAYIWRDYAYREGQLLGVALSEGTVRHFDVDHLGSVRLETDASGTLAPYRDFWPYGEEATPPAGTEQMKFTGHERDLGAPGSSADDLDYMHARYYRPIWGRFLSPDPAGGRLRRPQSWNQYSYTRSNPINRADPRGLIDCDGQICTDSITVTASRSIFDPFFDFLGRAVASVWRQAAYQAYELGRSPGAAAPSALAMAAFGFGGAEGEGGFEAEEAEIVELEALGGLSVEEAAAQEVAVGEIIIASDGAAHAAQNHFPGGVATTGKSVFFEGEEMAALVSAAETGVPTQQAHGTFVIIVDANRFVGHDQGTNQATSVYTVVIDRAGNLRNVFPGLPGGFR